MRANSWLSFVVAIGLFAAVAYIAYACGCQDATSVTISVPAEGSQATFNAASPGERAIPSTSAAVPDCNTQDIAWTCEDVSGTQEIWTPDPPLGGNATLTLRTLPSQNSQFGDTWIKASVDGKSDTNTFKLFFTEEATNNPGGTYPNWYYYWSQTSADYGTHNYDFNSAFGWTGFVNGAWRSYIGYDCNETSPSGTWNNAEGIDLFAHGCRHEERHRQDMNTLWGAGNNRTDAGDPDVDYLPTDNGTVTENSLGTPYHAGGYDPNDADSVPNHLNYGAGWKDSEDYAMHRQAAWNNGDANASDWANPGHQHS